MSPIPREDPNKEDTDVSELETPQFILPPDETETDEDELDMGGYQLLPQEPDTEPSPPESEAASYGSDESQAPLDQAITATLNNLTASGSFQGELPPPPSTEVSERLELWKESRPEQDVKPMDQAHADQIRQAMAGFSLPSQAVPNWAKVMPEAEWKSQLVTKLHAKPSETQSGHCGVLSRHSVEESLLEDGGVPQGWSEKPVTSQEWTSSFQSEMSHYTDTEQTSDLGT